jgi:hypothetical protein
MLWKSFVVNVFEAPRVERHRRDIASNAEDVEWVYLVRLVWGQTPCYDSWMAFGPVLLMADDISMVATAMPPIYRWVPVDNNCWRNTKAYVSSL